MQNCILCELCILTSKTEVGAVQSVFVLTLMSLGVLGP